MDGVRSQEQKTADIVAQAATATARAVFEAAQAAAAILAKDKGTEELEIGLLKQAVKTLAETQTNFEIEINRRLDSLEPKFDKIYAKLEEIAAGRPSWAILAVITFLSCTCVGLITYVVGHLS